MAKVKPLEVSKNGASAEPAKVEEVMQETPTLAAIGTDTIALSFGHLTIREPSYRQLFDTRIAAAQWAKMNPDIIEIDPGIRNWVYITTIVSKCSIKFVDRTGSEQSTPGVDELEEQMTARDFGRLSNALEPYLLTDEETDSDEKK